MTHQTKVVVGTRGSALALRQTDLILAQLWERFPHSEFQVRVIKTEGDRVQDRPISHFGDKGVFVRAIEDALRREEIDLAVHSLKDVPADVVTPGLQLAFSARADPRDVLISRSGRSLHELTSGSRVGTSSPRRTVQLRAQRPDLFAAGIRGNVDTRLRKLREGQYDAIILAAAGLERLGLDGSITQYLPEDQFLPDAGQGIMAVQTRVGSVAGELAAAIDCEESRLAARAERAVVRALGAGCKSPVAAYATVEGRRLRLRGMAASVDGAVLQRSDIEGPALEAQHLGQALGERLLRLVEAGVVESGA